MRLTGGIGRSPIGLSLLLASGLMSVFGASSSKAQIEWQGASGGNWNVSGNWVGGVVPNGNVSAENTTANTILVNSGTFAINGFNGTNAGASFEMFGGELDANNPGVSTFSMTGELICEGSPTLSGFVITAGGGVVNGTGTTTLNNITFAGGTLYQSNLNTQTIVNGSLTNNAGSNFQMDGGGGTNSELTLGSNTVFNGAGTVTLSTIGGGGQAFLQGNGQTLTNNSTIQGDGDFGNGSLAVINNGTINANVNGGVLTLSASGGVTNTGVMEASSGGVLNLQGITVNNAGGNITANSATDTVQIFGSTVIQGGSLNNVSGGSLGTPNGNVGILDGNTAAGAVTINGTYTGGLGSATYVRGSINTNSAQNGNLVVNGGVGNNTALLVDQSTVTLGGGGTVTLNTFTGGGSSVIEQNGAGTLINVNNTIQGEGIIGNNGLILVNGGLINANSGGGGVTNTLQLVGLAGTTVNTGVIEASNSGILQLDNITLNNAGGNITANPGAIVQLVSGATVQGGTLNNNGGSFFGTVAGYNAILDGATEGALTINGTYTSDFGSGTFIEGQINNHNLIQVNGGSGANTELLSDSPNLTLSGGGTVNLNTLSGGGSAFLEQNGISTLTNVNNTIQGEGVIGNNGLTLVNTAGGVIDANSTGGPNILTLQLVGLAGTTINQGVMEATNNGILQLDDITINNAGGSISANGAGTIVQLTGSANVQGGTLSNNGGAFFGTVSGQEAFLDGATNGAVTINGTYTSDFGSATFINGQINNNNLFQVNGGGGSNTELFINDGSVSLNGGGTVNLNTLTGGGNAFLEQNGSSTLTNVNNTIQGDGVIGNNGLTLINTGGGIIDANSNGGAQVTTLELVGLNLTNQGLVEATNNGVLQLNNIVINNAGGNITANGPGASVQLLDSATIQGGMINNNGGAFFGTVSGQEAFLDGATNGAVTINGTYTSDFNTNTFLIGTINNQGNIQVNGGAGTNTSLFIDGNVSLTGGGTVTLNNQTGGGNVIVDQNGTATLENVNNTIQGNGLIGNNGLSLQNDAGGTVLANVAGGTLLINGAGTVTNNGTFEVEAGSALHLQSVTNFTNFSGNTLTNGTYIVNGEIGNAGTLQIDSLGSTGGEIVNNAATIILNGPNSNFVDAAGLDALSQLAANTTATSNLTITGGRNLNTPGSFSNAGTVWIGTGSNMRLDGVNPTFSQSGGITTVNGTLGNADPMSFDLNAGILAGTGTVIGNVIGTGGTIAPGEVASTGELTINGNLTDTGSALDVRLGGTGGGQFDVLDVTGNVNLGSGSILDVSLFNGFTPTNGETFLFLDYGTLISQGLPDFFGTDNGLTTPGGTFSVSDTGSGLELTFTGNQGPPPPPNGTPEPAPMVMLASGALVWALLRKRARGRSVND